MSPIYPRCCACKVDGTDQGSGLEEHARSRAADKGQAASNGCSGDGTSPWRCDEVALCGNGARRSENEGELSLACPSQI
jgi:hypothetical protein